MSICDLIFKFNFCIYNRLNSLFTLDNIASCLFGIETNALQNENVTLINYLKKFFNRGLSNIILFIYCKDFSQRKQ